MDIDDIPILRHLRLAVGLLKAAALLFGWIIPLLLCLDYIGRYKERSYSQEAKWYYGLRAIMWGSYAWALSLISVSLITGIFNLPSPADGHWIYVTWLYSKVTGANPYMDYIFNDLMFSLGFGIAMYAWSWYFGRENSSGDFITHEPYEEELRKSRESGDTYTDLLRKERERKSK